jgi:hypothetical protein
MAQPVAGSAGAEGSPAACHPGDGRRRTDAVVIDGRPTRAHIVSNRRRSCCGRSCRRCCKHGRADFHESSAKMKDICGRRTARSPRWNMKAGYEFTQTPCSSAGERTNFVVYYHYYCYSHCHSSQIRFGRSGNRLARCVESTREASGDQRVPGDGECGIALSRLHRFSFVTLWALFGNRSRTGADDCPKGRIVGRVLLCLAAECRRGPQRRRHGRTDRCPATRRCSVEPKVSSV